jgi:hypothetical protein
MYIFSSQVLKCRITVVMCILLRRDCACVGRYLWLRYPSVVSTLTKIEIVDYPYNEMMIPKKINIFARKCEHVIKSNLIFIGNIDPVCFKLPIGYVYVK